MEGILNFAMLPAHLTDMLQGHIDVHIFTQGSESSISPEWLSIGRAQLRH